MKLGLNAYHTIADLWNADVAAERLIDLCENIIFAKKTKSPYENGICSEAKVMENDWRDFYYHTKESKNISCAMDIRDY